MVNQLRVWRAVRRRSLRKLSKDTGIEVTRVWKLENDYVEPTADERRVIAKALRVRQCDLWTSEPAVHVASIR